MSYTGRMKSNIEKRTVGWLGRRVITASYHASYLLARIFPNAIPIIFVMGYPKSGTVWACQMVSDYLQLPFADLSFFPIGFPSVMHGHSRVSPKGPPAVYVVRDGRDAMVSMYFFLSHFVPEGDHPRGVPTRLHRYFRGIVNRDRVRENLPRFIEAQMRRPLGSRAHWGDHVKSYFESERTDVPIMKYEDMLVDCSGALTSAIRTLTGEDVDPEAIQATVRKFSFERQSGRARGTEDRSNFLRKGQRGDWRNHFSREAAEVFNAWCGAQLIRTGYEPDASWVHSV